MHWIDASSSQNNPIHSDQSEVPVLAGCVRSCRLVAITVFGGPAAVVLLLLLLLMLLSFRGLLAACVQVLLVQSEFVPSLLLDALRLGLLVANLADCMVPATQLDPLPQPLHDRAVLRVWGHVVIPHPNLRTHCVAKFLAFLMLCLSLC